MLSKFFYCRVLNHYIKPIDNSIMDLKPYKFKVGFDIIV